MGEVFIACLSMPSVNMMSLPGARKLTMLRLKCIHYEYHYS